MQKRSHLLLARRLLDAAEGFSKKRFEAAFLTGSCQPDCNPLTYLKGFFRGQRLMGHNYANARLYIFRRIRRLQRRRRWNLWHYYTLGKLTHYLADAFTFPHNEHFPGTLADHHRYESRLRLVLELNAPAPPAVPPSADLPAALDRLHREYRARPSCPTRDASYILRSGAMLMNCFFPAKLSAAA